MKFDVAVVGAGIVGVCVAINLQKRGLAVLLVDRSEPGSETSYGNAGLIERQAIVPYAFPRNPLVLLRYALNRSVDVHFHPLALLRIAPFLYRYWHCSSPSQLARIAVSYAELIKHCIIEHEVLIAEAHADHLIRRKGWLKVFRTGRERDVRFREAESWSRNFGIRLRLLDRQDVHQAEPFLMNELSGAIHWLDPICATDPNGLVLAYAGLFSHLGGTFAQADARSLMSEGLGWTLRTATGVVQAKRAVITLGPWADSFVRRLGYKPPLAVKRGYHMHYRAAGTATLHHPVLDAERGYLIAPMIRGIRLTTGVEFAKRDAPTTAVQLNRAEPIARDFFPLGERVDPHPWLGARPCTPDMMPIIGPAPRHQNLWFAFGHAHHGLTLAGITGRLIADMVTSTSPIVEPTPFRVDRF